MINEETIVSVYNDKMTLLQFLKTVNKALDEAVLTSVEVSKKGNATLSFVFEFADGTKIESGEIVLQQGESVTDAKIVDGHLYLTLSNDERLDAGNVKPVTRFEINASQHLIVYYGDGTSQDLGAILQGNVNIDGNFTANSIIENMNGYSFEKIDTINWTPVYVGCVKNGNKLTMVVFGKYIKHENDPTQIYIGKINIPLDVGNKLYEYGIGGFTNSVLGTNVLPCYYNEKNYVNIPLLIIKYSATSVAFKIMTSELQNNTEYYFRIETTFLLSDNMVAQQ